MLAQLQKERFQLASLIAPTGEVYHDANHASLSSARLPVTHPIYQRVAERIRSHLTDINTRFDVELFDQTRLMPDMIVNQYDANAGGHLNQHSDMGAFGGTDQRKLTLVLLLNDDFEGGEFVINDGILYHPLKEVLPGTAAVFASFRVHAVNPVTAGKRWSIVVWLKGPRYR